MATGTLLPWGRQEWADNNWNPLSGGTLRIDVAGTSTLATVYSDGGLTSAITNPITLNSAGRPTSDGSTECSIFGTPGTSYKFTLKDSGGSTIWTQDNILAVPASAANVDISATIGESLNVGQVAYLSDGSGGKTAGVWYKADNANAYSSMTGVVGLAPNRVTVGSGVVLGTIRTGGSVTGMSGLTVGAAYYLGTSGNVTATAPATNSRFLGEADSTTSIVLQPTGPFTVVTDNSACDGRLTLTSGLPVTTSDVTGATSIYFTPFRGNRIALYDGTSVWNIRTFSEITQALGTLTSGLPYDIFAYDNAGVVTLEMLAWTNGTTRATALAFQNGVLVKSGVTTRRYLGTFYTTSTTATEDSNAKRLVWNYYNRVVRPLVVTEATDSWAYSTGTIRQANGSTANQIALVSGYAEDAISVDVAVSWKNDNGAQPIGEGFVGIGENSVTAFSAGLVNTRQDEVVASAIMSSRASLRRIPAAGYSYYAWLEYSSGAGGTTTWFGDNGQPTLNQSGIQGMWKA